MFLSDIIVLRLFSDQLGNLLLSEIRSSGSSKWSSERCDANPCGLDPTVVEIDLRDDSFQSWSNSTRTIERDLRPDVERYWKSRGRGWSSRCLSPRWTGWYDQSWSVSAWIRLWPRALPWQSNGEGKSSVASLSGLVDLPFEIHRAMSRSLSEVHSSPGSSMCRSFSDWLSTIVLEATTQDEEEKGESCDQRNQSSHSVEWQSAISSKRPTQATSGEQWFTRTAVDVPLRPSTLSTSGISFASKTLPLPCSSLELRPMVDASVWWN